MGRVLLGGPFWALATEATSMLLEVAPEWSVDIDRGPDWLFIRLRPPRHGDTGEISLAEMIWEKLDQSFCHRVVLEFDEVTFLPKLDGGRAGQAPQAARLAGRDDADLRSVRGQRGRAPRLSPRRSLSRLSHPHRGDHGAPATAAAVSEREVRNSQCGMSALHSAICKP